MRSGRCTRRRTSRRSSWQSPIPSAAARTAENIVVPVAMLKRVAPDFSAGNAIVVATDAANLEEDARVLQTTELPSQADDLDGDGKYDELVFQIDLGAEPDPHRDHRVRRPGDHPAPAQRNIPCAPR